MCKNPINKIEYRYHFNKKSASECQFSPHGSAGDPYFFQSAPSSQLFPPKSSFQDRSKSKKIPSGLLAPEGIQGLISDYFR